MGNSAVGVLRQPLQRHGASSGRADHALSLITPMRRNLGVRVQGKAVDTGTPRTREGRAFSCLAKARADAAHGLSGSFSTSDALLDRRRHCQLNVENYTFMQEEMNQCWFRSSTNPWIFAPCILSAFLKGKASVSDFSLS